jgi:tetratricopeptide (TPR) repeat protein
MKHPLITITCFLTLVSTSFGQSKFTKDETIKAKIIAIEKSGWNAWNTYDSYGECLLLMGDTENGIKAYKKSLELNPENESAIKVLSELKLEN